jgi:hypothetical protein
MTGYPAMQLGTTLKTRKGVEPFQLTRFRRRAIHHALQDHLRFSHQLRSSSAINHSLEVNRQEHGFAFQVEFGARIQHYEKQ